MYLAEFDSAGNPKKDNQGKIVLKLGEGGEPMINPSSEKYKIWESIYNLNPSIASAPNAPELLMGLMERKLRVKGEQMVKDAQHLRNNQVEEGQVVQDGVTPPKKVDVKFYSEEEKAHALSGVNRGVYKDLEDYVKNRDTKDEGVYDENRTPVFGSKSK